MQKLKNILPLVVALFLVTAGFFFRLKGITDNHSFWSDEALSASYARDIAAGKTELIKGAMAIAYQPLHILTMSLFMKFFGYSEFAARLPAVLFGTLGILIAYLLTKRFSDISGGLLAAFLFSFSQINLANSTQAKPTALLQTTTVLIIYLMTVLNSAANSKKIFLHFLIMLIIVITTLFHFLGALLSLIYLTYLFFSWRNIFFRISILAIVVLGLLIYQKAEVSLAVFNNTIYLKNLLLRQYGIFLLPALFSLFFLFKKFRAVLSGIIVYSFFLLVWWNFQSYSHNLRYIAPFFGILFILTSIGIQKIGNILFNKRSWIFTSATLLILLLTQYKVTVKPKPFYSPNTDFYGDVQIANYKEFYNQLERKFPNLEDIVVYNDVLDTQRWYMKKQPDAYFTKPLIHRNAGKNIYSSLTDFKKLMSKNNKGLLIVEDWESILPEDIKQYAKKNLKLELRVESLPEAKDDPWPLELYSWGI